MYNAMLDRLPEDYNGWLIRTDYRIGVQIQLCISDPELSDNEKTAIALNLLYGRGMPDLQTAIDGLSWFCRVEIRQTMKPRLKSLYSLLNKMRRGLCPHLGRFSA